MACLLLLSFSNLFFGLTNFKHVCFRRCWSSLCTTSLKMRTVDRIFCFLFSLPAVALINAFINRAILGSDAILFIVNNFIRRLLFTPPMLDERYVEFFSVNPLYYWSTSRFSFGFIKNPYDTSAPFVIGLEYFGSSKGCKHRLYRQWIFPCGNIRGTVICRFLGTASCDP